MNKCVYKSASCLWLWVIKSDLLMANSTKTCTHIHTEEAVWQNMLLITAHGCTHARTHIHNGKVQEKIITHAKSSGL